MQPDPDAWSEPDAPPRSAAGPWLLLLPLVFLCVSVLFLTREERPPGAEPRAEPARPESVPGWEGRLEAPGGLRLHARLTRLHPQVERQTHDAAALAARFALGAGEPWRLSLRVVAEGAAADDGAELRLSGLEVAGAQGARLSALLRPAPPPPDGVADPLAVLLAPPDALRPGEEAQLVLWGVEPDAAPSLRGLVLAGEPLELALERRALEAGPDESVLARVEVFARRGAPGEEERDE